MKIQGAKGANGKEKHLKLLILLYNFLYIELYHVNLNYLLIFRESFPDI